MKFTDERGKVLTRKEVAESGYGHLLEVARFLTCDKCGRKEYDNALKDKSCNMTQPDNSICGGILKEVI